MMDAIQLAVPVSTGTTLIMQVGVALQSLDSARYWHPVLKCLCASLITYAEATRRLLISGLLRLGISEFECSFHGYRITQ